ncbi:MAG TPA: cysteine dioxygenase family protein [Thermoleophilaceae bacterium]
MTNADWVTIAKALTLPARKLDSAELARVAQAVVDTPELWERFVNHDPAERQYTSLYVDDHIGIWLICWMPGHDTGFHDHDESSGGVAVASGSVREERPVWGREPRRIDPGPGEGFHFDETEIHRVLNVTEEPAVTIHCYSPPLQRMGAYLVERDGYLRRRPIAWDERLEAKSGVASAPPAAASSEAPRSGRSAARGRRRSA